MCSPKPHPSLIFFLLPNKKPERPSCYYCLKSIVSGAFQASITSFRPLQQYSPAFVSDWGLSPIREVGILCYLLLIYLLDLNLTIFGLYVVSDDLAQCTETSYKFVHWKVEPQCLQRSLLLRMSILPQLVPTPNDIELLQ